MGKVMSEERLEGRRPRVNSRHICTAENKGSRGGRPSLNQATCDWAAEHIYIKLKKL